MSNFSPIRLPFGERIQGEGPLSSPLQGEVQGEGEKIL